MTRNIGLRFLIAVLLLVPWALHGQTVTPSTSPSYGLTNPSFVTLNVRPGLEIPIGEDADLYGLGGSLSLEGSYGFTDRPEVFLTAAFTYSLIPVQAEETLSLLDLAVGAGVSVEVAPRLNVSGLVRSGIYYGFITEGTEDPGQDSPLLSLTGGIAVDYLISSRFNATLGAVYRKAFGLYDGVGLFLGGTYYFKGRERQGQRIDRALPLKPGALQGGRSPKPDEGIAVGEITLNPIFPVFCKYYDDHPIGWIVLHNQERSSITDFSLSVLIAEYMDVPKKCRAPETFGVGETVEVELNALFSDRVLGVTEGTKTPCEIRLEYSIEGVRYQDVRSETLRILDRNAMTWDDDRKASAFVTAKDPAVLSFAKNVSSMIHDAGSRAVDANLRKAIGVHEALDAYGIRYEVDPKTPYAEYAQSTEAIDFLQFPRQTLGYTTGDCDDLAILYCSLLEALSIETAFITIPGHIYMAFSLGIEEEQARRTLENTDDVIFRSGKAWIPVEITERSRGFLEAWQNGAREWRRHAGTDQLGFYPIHEAWAVYEPVGLTGEGAEITLPATSRILTAYLDELQRYVDREIYPQVVRLEEEIRRTGGNARIYNKLGILYAKYGRMDKAEAIFEENYRIRQYLPSLTNLGNVAMLREDWSAALDYLEQARRMSPENPFILLNISRVHYELENYDLATRTFVRVRETDPSLAQRYAYLDLKGDANSGRASDVITERGSVEWVEE